MIMAFIKEFIKMFALLLFLFSMVSAFVVFLTSKGNAPAYAFIYLLLCVAGMIAVGRLYKKGVIK